MVERRALLFGGTGHLGSEVLRGLTRAGVPTAFTYWRAEERAAALSRELGQEPRRVDLRDPRAIIALCGGIAPPDIFVCCAGVADVRTLAEIDDETWDHTMAVNVRAPFVACRELFGATRHGPSHVVLTAALDAVRLLASPAHFGTSQAALVGLTRALAKELGPRDVRVNLVVIGPLDGGVAKGFDPARQAAYERFSALGRVAAAAEAARAVVWMALQNRAMNGAVLPVTGGL